MTQTPARDPDIYDQLDQIVLWINNQILNGPNLVLIQNNLELVLEGAFTSDVLNLIKSDRSTLAGLLTPESMAAMLRPVLREIMRSDGQEPSEDDAAMLQRWRELLLSDADTFQTRGISFGTLTAGGANVGDGTIYRVTVDKDGVTREGVTPETKRFECVEDQSSGTPKHQETFRVTGEKANYDSLEWGTANAPNSDADEELNARSAADSTVILNPSFSDHAGVTPTPSTNTVLANSDDLTGYNIDTPANVEVSVDQVYREIPGEATSRSLYITGDVQITQVIRNTTNFAFDRLVPYFRAIAVYKEAGATGTFNYDLGTDTHAVSLASLSTGWNVVIPTLDESLFYDNFTEDDITLNIQVASLAVANIYLDDQVIVAMDPVDGTWWVILGGATPFQTEDFFTMADTESNSPLAKVARVLWLAFGEDGYLRTSGTPTRADP